METNERIAQMLEDRGPMSAAEVTKALREIGELPPYWSVIDVADYMRDWFSGDKA
jgi:hypothetical protein